MATISPKNRPISATSGGQIRPVSAWIHYTPDMTGDGSEYWYDPGTKSISWTKPVDADRKATPGAPAEGWPVSDASVPYVPNWQVSAIPGLDMTGNGTLTMTAGDYLVLGYTREEAEIAANPNATMEQKRTVGNDVYRRSGATSGGFLGLGNLDWKSIIAGTALVGGAGLAYDALVGGGGMFGEAGVGSEFAYGGAQTATPGVTSTTSGFVAPEVVPQVGGYQTDYGIFGDTGASGSEFSYGLTPSGSTVPAITPADFGPQGPGGVPPAGWDTFVKTLPAGVQSVLSGLDAKTLAGVAGAIMGATQGQPAPITTTVTPWGPAQAGMEAGLKATQDQLAKSGSFSAPAVPAASTYTNPYTAPNAPKLPTYANTYTAPSVTAPTSYGTAYTDQYLRDAITGAIRPLNEQFSNVIMPAIGSSAQGNGQFGSSRQAIAEALAAQKLGQTSGDISSQLMNQFAQSRAANILGTNTLNSGNITNYNQLLAAIAQAKSQGAATSNALNSSNALSIYGTQAKTAADSATGESATRTLNSDNLWKNYGAQYKTAADEFTYPWNALTAANNIFSQAGGIARTTNTPLPETPWWQTALAGAGAAYTAAQKLFPGA